MTSEDFERLQALMASRTGHALLWDRMQLAEHRLGPVARREGYHNVEALLNHIWTRPLGALGWEVIETLLNGETWFRRDRTVFNLYAQELLPVLHKARSGRPIRIWCAGTGSGQEAYSLAMLAMDQGIEVQILGTDLSSRALSKAKDGIYSGFEIQRGLSAQTMLDWFTPIGDQWQANPKLKSCVRFERSNLLDPLAPELCSHEPFDLVFCRYVLGDILPDRRHNVLDHLCATLHDSGCLFLGLDEKLTGTSFRQVAGQNGLFVKSPQRASRAA